jgi:hypothetical protein
MNPRKIIVTIHMKSSGTASTLWFRSGCSLVNSSCVCVARTQESRKRGPRVGRLHRESRGRGRRSRVLSLPLGSPQPAIGPGPLRVIWGSDGPKQKYKYGWKKPDQTPGETGPNQNERDVQNNNLFETKEPNHGTLTLFIIRYRYRF